MTASVIHQPPNWLDRLDWQAVFGNARPVEVDLGCGKGGFLLQTAAAHPEINFLGVDRLLGRLRQVDARAQRRGLGNVRLLRIEGGYLVAYLLPPQSVSVCHVYFPDPWPKRRHHRRRLFSAGFVAEAHAALAADGELRVATDHADYFAGICRVMNDSGRFREIAAEDALVGAGTDFERKFSAEGRKIHRARWRKLAGGVSHA